MAGYIPVIVSSICHTNKPDFSKYWSSANRWLYSKIKYSWSRYQLGFINPIIIDNVQNAEEIILPAETGGENIFAMILPMDSNMPQEYLILENRQQLGADQYLEKSGLLVWHIDETITGMYPALNSVNVNPEFYGVNLLQADGVLKENKRKGLN